MLLDKVKWPVIIIGLTMIVTGVIAVRLFDNACKRIYRDERPMSRLNVHHRDFKRDR